jgi:hypothetical protein
VTTYCAIGPTRYAILAIGALLAGLVWLDPAIAAADKETGGISELIGSPRELAAALRSGTPRRLLLAPGEYGEIELGKASSNFRIGAADPASPPRLSRITIADARELTLENLIVEPKEAPRLSHQYVLGILRSSSIRLTGLKVNGAKAPPSAELRGILVEDSSNVRIADSSFTACHRAVLAYRSKGLTLEHNDIANMSSDGFNFAEVEDVSILQNRFGGFSPTPESHADYIQFWSDQTERPSTNILIAENVMVQTGPLDAAQGIYLQFEARMPARDVVVRDNVIVQSSPHGISLYNVSNGKLERNLVLSSPQSQYKVAVRVINSADITLTDNVSMAFGVENTRNIVRSRNATIDFADKRALEALQRTIENLLATGEGRLPLNSAATISAAHRAAGPRPLNQR